MKKIGFVLIIICIAILGYAIGYYNCQVANQDEIRKSDIVINGIDFENQYLYPQQIDNENESISVDYTESILCKMTQQEELTDDERDLIIFHEVQDDGYGLAYTQYQEGDGGMGKATRRLWETTDGEHWNVLSEEIYSMGYHDFTYIDNIFIESSFSMNAEKGYFNISSDRGHVYKSIPTEELFEYDGIVYPKKISENKEKKTITYQWVDLYSKEIISTIEYDLELNTINEIR